MEVSDAKRLKDLEEESAKLKMLLAESMMDVLTLREMLGKTSDAWLKEKCRELGNPNQGVVATMCPWAGRH